MLNNQEIIKNINIDLGFCFIEKNKGFLKEKETFHIQQIDIKANKNNIYSITFNTNQILFNNKEMNIVYSYKYFSEIDSCWFSNPLDNIDTENVRNINIVNNIYFYLLNNKYYNGLIEGM